MQPVSQNSAIESLNQSLVPDTVLIDARTETDQLAFLTEYAALINFYDSSNHLNGSWQPFLLKDPVFLLAAVSKTPLQKMHTRYGEICQEIRSSLGNELRSMSIGRSFNQLFDHLTTLFSKLETWSSFMIRYPGNYKLKSFVLGQIQSMFSACFWAVLALREELVITGCIKQIQPVDFFLRQSYNELVWSQNRNKKPFWEVLHLNHPVTANSPADFFAALARVGDELYRFLELVVRNAASELEELKDSVSRYPDTTLLRSFINLLQVHRNQLNGVTARHLDFYYRDILKQHEKTAVADRVFVCPELADKTSVFLMAAQTPLSAGVDTNGNAVVFNTLKEVVLNPAVVSQVFTVSTIAGDAGTAITVQPVMNTAIVQKNEAGQVQSWKTFGTSMPPVANAQKLGFAFASPILLLREGNRLIEVALNYTGTFDNTFFKSLSFYLSTKTAWLNVTPFVKQNTTATTGQLLFSILLDSAQPPIEAFVQNPDGVQSSWPMLKITQDTFSNPADQPVVESLEINVFVSGLKNLQLANDNGALNAKAPFQLFGSAPLYGSRFIIGSNELFSKPLRFLGFHVQWDKLPDDFKAYYEQYNAYIKDPIVPVVPKEPGIIKTIWEYLKKIYGVLKIIVDWIRRKKPIPYEDLLKGPFNNICFTVEFDLLKNRNWKTFNMNKDRSITVDPKDPSISTVVTYTDDPGCKRLKAEEGILLFSTDGKDCTLEDTSYFSYGTLSPETGVTETSLLLSPDEADPSIQNSTSAYSAASSSGFMSMSLSGPDYGFGSGIYASVVSNVALKNAALISQQPHESKAKLVLPPNPPFVPKVKSLVVDQYSASVKYDFNYQQGGYPVQCYHYTPFANYRVYDNTLNQDQYWQSIGIPLVGPRRLVQGISLFPQLEFTGTLLIGLDDLIVPAELNLYFELTRTYAQGSPPQQLYSYALCDDYWQPLSIIADSTNNFSCSGIVTVQLKKEISQTHFSMPSGKCWLAFCTKDQPDAFPQTAFLKTNGAEAVRVGTAFLSGSVAPQLAAGVITKPQKAIPPVSGFVQPFASFGGQPAETSTQMTRRVSNRIKTRDRAVNTEDVFRMIRIRFSEVYYSGVVVKRGKTGKPLTQVFVVPSFADSTVQGAFTPLISACKEVSIKNYLNTRVSALTQLQVSNFTFRYVQVLATITLQDGYEQAGITKKLMQALNIYLSPWISDPQQQVKIDEPITSAQAASFIKLLEGIEAVSHVSFQLFDNINGQKKMNGSPLEILEPIPGILFVSEMTHVITVA